eukprot:1139799-Rhodomonas_salina.1
MLKQVLLEVLLEAVPRRGWDPKVAPTNMLTARGEQRLSLLRLPKPHIKSIAAFAPNFTRLLMATCKAMRKLVATGRHTIGLRDFKKGQATDLLAAMNALRSFGKLCLEVCFSGTGWLYALARVAQEKP